jgi:hypothetical protein
LYLFLGGSIHYIYGHGVLHVNIIKKNKKINKKYLFFCGGNAIIINCTIILGESQIKSVANAMWGAGRMCVTVFFKSGG